MRGECPTHIYKRVGLCWSLRRRESTRLLNAQFPRTSLMGAVSAPKSGMKLRKKSASPRNTLTSTPRCHSRHLQRLQRFHLGRSYGRVPSLPTMTPGRKQNSHLLKWTDYPASIRSWRTSQMSLKCSPMVLLWSRRSPSHFSILPFPSTG